MSKLVVSFGEIMLRLAPPGLERFFQSPQLLATFGGGEANVAVAVANFGLPARYLTVLPEKHPAADACVRGANQRPSAVTYDRDRSSIALAGPGSIDWEESLKGATWFHITGITPAISESAAALAMESVTAARSRGITVSCDLNFRKNLWKWGKKAHEVMPELFRHVDVGIANEEDCQLTLGIHAEADVESGKLSASAYQKLTEAALAAYPQLKLIAVTLRESRSASNNSWSACLHNRYFF
jgi:2-dehydro-3-deoxygluconokinase